MANSLGLFVLRWSVKCLYNTIYFCCWEVTIPPLESKVGMNFFLLLAFDLMWKYFVLASDNPIHVNLACCLAQVLCRTARPVTLCLSHLRRSLSSRESNQTSCAVSSMRITSRAICRRKLRSSTICFLHLRALVILFSLTWILRMSSKTRTDYCQVFWTISWNPDSDTQKESIWKLVYLCTKASPLRRSRLWSDPSEECAERWAARNSMSHSVV